MEKVRPWCVPSPWIDDAKSCLRSQALAACLRNLLHVRCIADKLNDDDDGRRH